jgi:hypothetical protein
MLCREIVIVCCEKYTEPTRFNKLYGENFRVFAVDLVVGTVATRQGVNILSDHDVKI